MAVGLELHDRVTVTDAAALELREWTLDWLTRHGLTPCEALRALADEVELVARLGVRMERHPDKPDARADQA